MSYLIFSKLYLRKILNLNPSISATEFHFPPNLSVNIITAQKHVSVARAIVYTTSSLFSPLSDTSSFSVRSWTMSACVSQVVKPSERQSSSSSEWVCADRWREWRSKNKHHLSLFPFFFGKGHLFLWPVNSPPEWLLDKTERKRIRPEL